MNDKLFLNGLQEFCEQAIKNAESGTTAESQTAKIQKSINEALEALQLECKVNFGSGIAANEQGIAFVRQDTLGKEYVNGEKPTPTKGIYIWFCCIKEKENFCLEFGCSRKEKPDCEAFDRMKENGCFGNEEGRLPALQELRRTLAERFGSANKAPQSFRDAFRKKSLPLMKYTNILSFNWRTIALFCSLLLEMPWLYFAFELVVLNGLLVMMVLRHERICRNFTKALKDGKY